MVGDDVGFNLTFNRNSTTVRKSSRSKKPTSKAKAASKLKKAPKNTAQTRLTKKGGDSVKMTKQDLITKLLKQKPALAAAQAQLKVYQPP